MYYRDVKIDGCTFCAWVGRPYIVRILYDDGVLVDHSVKSWGAAQRWLKRGARSCMVGREGYHDRLWSYIVHIPTKSVMGRQAYTPTLEIPEKDFEAEVSEWADL